MDRLWVIGGLLAAWFVLRVAGRPLLALAFARQRGKQALANVPPTVHLTRRGDDAWKDPDAARRTWEPLLAHGFADAGTHAVDEMPGVLVRLLASSRDSILAMVYEHPKAGQWLEFSSTYTDGRRCAATNHRAPGVDAPDFVTMVRAVEAPPLELLELFASRRPVGAMRPITAADAASRFEQGYAESMAWHQQHPITTREVVSVGMKRAA